MTRVSRWANRRNRRLKENIRQTLAAGVDTASAGAQLDLMVTRGLHFQALFARCRAMLSLIKQSKLSGLVDRATIMQLIDTVHAGQVTLAIHPDSAGGPRRVRSLAEIGDFLGPVSQAIWVGPFRQPSPRAPWSSGDMARANAAHALNLDFTAGRLEAETRAEEAGLCHLSGSLLILAHPSGDGAARPHPLWLMITEILRNALPTPQPFAYEPDLLDSSQAPVQLAPWAIARAMQPLEPEPAWVTTISLDPSMAMPRRRTVSHSDIERRLTCPVAWAFEYGAHLAPSANAALPSAAISRGTVGERVLREVFATSPPQNLPDAFAKLAHILRRRLPRLHAELCSPLAREQREEFEISLHKALPVLYALIDSGIAITFGAKLDRFTDPSGNSIAWQGLSPRGAIDALGTVMLNHARVPIVIDMKFGGADPHGTRLKQGNCTQLVLYSNFVELRDPTTPVDSIGYLVISEGCLLVPAWAAGFLLASPALAQVV
ncbi:MAG: PD-(D/E)XK nuclease family protein, partial [Chloroflexota bacterium]